MKLFIDTEFNDFRGKLISMGIVAEDGQEWYEALPCPWPAPLVRDNVIPVLFKEPLLSPADFSLSLGRWLRKFETIHVIADWPEDLEHFLHFLIVGPGCKSMVPPLTMELCSGLPNTADTSEIPHNALADARALFKSYQERN